MKMLSFLSTFFPSFRSSELDLKYFVPQTLLCPISGKFPTTNSTRLLGIQWNQYRGFSLLISKTSLLPFPSALYFQAIYCHIAILFDEIALASLGNYETVDTGKGVGFFVNRVVMVNGNQLARGLTTTGANNSPLFAKWRQTGLHLTA